MRASFFAIFGVSIAIAFSGGSAYGQKANAKNQKKRPQVQYELFNADDVLKMTAIEQEQYFDALREFHEARQYRAPKFSAYFLDVVLGGFMASAATEAAPLSDYDKCTVILSSGASNGDTLSLDKECFGRFLRATSDGAFGRCSVASAPHSVHGYELTHVTCPRYQGDRSPKRFTIQTKSDGQELVRRAGTESHRAADDENRRRSEQQVSNPPAGSGPAAPTTQSPPTGTAPGGGASSQTSPPTGAPSAGGAQRPPSPAQDSTGPARCFFAGFALNRNGDRGACTGVTDVCQNMHLRAPKDSSLKTLLNCSGRPNIGKCGGNTAGAPQQTSVASPQAPSGAAGSAPVTTTRPSGTQVSGSAPGGAASTNPITSSSRGRSNQVVCNPILYGTQEDGTMLCVPRSSNASTACRGIKKDQKLLELLGKPGGKEAFNEMIDSLQRECRPYWNLGTDGNWTESGNAPQRTGDTNANDFKETCGVLLRRAIEIGSGQNTPREIQLKVDSLRGSAQATGAPAAGTAAPAPRPTR